MINERMEKHSRSGDTITLYLSGLYFSTHGNCDFPASEEEEEEEIFVLGPS